MATILIVFCLSLNRIPGSWSEKLKKADKIGTFLFVGSVTTILMPITWGGVQYPWSSWRTLVPLCTGLVGLACFSIYEKIWAMEPMIPSSIFPNLSANLGYFASWLQGLLLYCLLYYLPLYLEAVKGHSPVLTGVVMLPSTFGISPAAVIAGVLISVTSSYRWTLWLG